MKKLSVILALLLLGLPVLLAGEAGRCLSGNCADGSGVQEDSFGRTYTGVFSRGKFHGKGTMTWPGGRTYTGEWQDGREHGEGSLTLADGRRFVGTFREGFLHGEFLVYAPDGSLSGRSHRVMGRHEGICVAGDCMEGRGRLRFDDGSSYEGWFSYGSPCGYGTEYGPDGSARKRGRWTGGRQSSVCVFGDCENGRGFDRDESGDVYEGEFRDGLKHGRGTLVYSFGHRYEGQWDRGRKHGQGTLYDAKGLVIKSGRWENDQFAGEK